MHPQPLFGIFGFSVYLYGICMALGIVCCFVFLYLAMRFLGFNEEARDKILVIGFFGTGFGIFSAMLFQSVYNYIANPSAGFKLGGMTFIGGLIGGVASFLAVWNIYVYAIAPKAKSKLLQNNMNAGLSDALTIIPIGICIAHAFGRLGCFFGGCCYGHETDAWYGMYVAQTYYPDTNTVVVGDMVVPTQLFEMLFLFALAAVLALLFFKWKFKYNFAVYAIAYGIWRFLIEFVRGDERGQFLGTALYPSQFWSIIMVILGVGYVFLQMYVLAPKMKLPWLKKEQKEEPAPAEGKEE